MNRSILVLLAILLGALSACDAVAPAGGLDALPAYQRTPTATLIPAYVQTPQAASAEAQATIAAVNAAAAEAQLAQAYLLVTQTTIALDYNRAEATRVFFVRETENATTATAIASQQALEGTAQAVAAQSTATASMQAAVSTATAQAATATWQAYANQVSGTQTQSAVKAVVASVDAQIAVAEAQKQADLARIAAEETTSLFQAWAGRGVLIVVLGVGLYTLWRAIPWFLLHAFGVQRVGDHVIIVTPNREGGFTQADMSRSLAPGIVTDGNGRLLTAGSAQDAQLQERVTSRAQSAEMLRAAAALPTEMRAAIFREQAGLDKGANNAIAARPRISVEPPPALAQPHQYPELGNATLREETPEHPAVNGWIQDVHVRLLEDVD